MNSSDFQNDVKVALWKQRLFEIGIVVVLAIVLVELLSDHVPLYLEVVFVVLAVISVAVQHRKLFSVVKITSDHLEFDSPKVFGKRHRIALSSIKKIEEVDGIYTTLVVLLVSGKEHRVVLEKFLGTCYSRGVTKQLRELFRAHDIPFEIRNF